MEGNEKKESLKATVSLVLGIISILTALFWYITVPTGIIAIIFGAKSAVRIGSKMGKAGLILGIIGIVLFILIYISITLLIFV